MNGWVGVRPGFQDRLFNYKEITARGYHIIWRKYHKKHNNRVFCPFTFVDCWTALIYCLKSFANTKIRSLVNMSTFIYLPFRQYKEINNILYSNVFLSLKPKNIFSNVVLKLKKYNVSKIWLKMINPKTNEKHIHRKLFTERANRVNVFYTPL